MASSRTAASRSPQLELHHPAKDFPPLTGAQGAGRQWRSELRSRRANRNWRMQAEVKVPSDDDKLARGISGRFN
eukprot:3699194-Pyramimonas_sp.AAC.1